MTLQQTVTATEMTDAIDALAATSASIAETVGEIAPIAARHKAGAKRVKQTIQVMAESFPQPRSGYVDGKR